MSNWTYQKGYNHKQRRENMERYVREKSATAPELHLLHKNGEINEAALARHLGLTDKPNRTIPHFFSDEPHEFKNKTYSRIVEHTGIHEAYWRGLTTEQDNDKYEAEHRERLEAEGKMDELERLQAEKHRNEVKRLTTFFDLLGYGYECSDDWDSDYLGIKELHTITRKGTSESQKLTDGELDNVMKAAAGFLDYALYKIRRE